MKFMLLIYDSYISFFRMSDIRRLCRVGAYPMYALVLLLLAYLLNQLDRYMLAITTKPLAQEIHYGDLACMKNSSYHSKSEVNVTCNGTTQEKYVTVVCKLFLIR